MVIQESQTSNEILLSIKIHLLILDTACPFFQVSDT